MMKKILILTAFFLFTLKISAQTTTVTATVVDSDSTAWTNGSWRVVFVPNQAVDPNPSHYNINGTPLSPSVTNQAGALSNSAGLSLSVYQNAVISPSGSSWNLTICPNAITACGTLNFQAAGSTMNVSSDITATIVAPRFIAVANSYGYTDGEATLQLRYGSTYYNVVSLTQRCYNGASWGDCGSGGGSTPGSPNGSVQYNNNAALGGDPAYLYADAFVGSDWVAKVTACLTALETAGGGTCNAVSLAGQTSTSTLTWGDATHILNLQLGPGVYTANNFIYRTYSQIHGAGNAGSSTPPATVLECTETTASNACVKGYPETSFGNQLHNPILSGFMIVPSVAATQGDGSTGFLLGGTGNVDVLNGQFYDLWSNGFDTGTGEVSVGGCICYNIFNNVNNTGNLTASIHTVNLSGYPFGLNSNHWTGGKQWGTIGLWDTNGQGNTWDGVMDFEHNTSYTGAILYVRPIPTENGSGYAVGDTVQPAGGNGDAVLTVASISGGGDTGPVTGLTITTPGTGYTNGTYSENAPVSTTALTGSGTGLFIDQLIQASRLLLNNDGGKFDDAYIEDSTGQQDYLCTTQAYLLWAKPGYGGARCPGFPVASGTSAFGAGDSTFIEGSGGVPSSIGLTSGTQGPNVPGYIAYHETAPFDPLLFINNSNTMWTYPPYYPAGVSDEINLFPNGPTWNGTASQFTRLGPAPWVVGESTITGGQNAQGLQTLSQIPQPSAPTVTVNCIGSCATSYTFYVVGFDDNGGETIPSSGTTITNGPDTLVTDGTISITPPWPTNPSVGPMQYGITCWDVLIGTTSTYIKNSTLGGCPDYGFSSWSLIYSTQATASFSPLSRTTTGDSKVAGFLKLNTDLGLTDAGTCAMATDTSCTHTVPAGSNNCSAVVQGATPIAAACAISGTTATVTAASSNSDTWLIISTE